MPGYPTPYYNIPPNVVLCFKFIRAFHWEVYGTLEEFLYLFSDIPKKDRAHGWFCVFFCFQPFTLIYQQIIAQMVGSVSLSFVHLCKDSIISLNSRILGSKVQWNWCIAVCLPLFGSNMYSQDLELPSIYISCHLYHRNQTQTSPPRYGKCEVLLLLCVQIISVLLVHRCCYAISLCHRGSIAVPCDYFSFSWFHPLILWLWFNIFYILWSHG